LPATEPVQDRVEVPEPAGILVALRVQERFVELVVTASVTVPANPVVPGATVIVDGPETPAFWVTLVGLATTEKSWKWKVINVEFLAPVAVTVTFAVSV